MKVIKRGIPAKERVYQTTCKECDSILEFHKSETRIVNDRNEMVYVVNCPVCGNDIWISADALRGR